MFKFILRRRINKLARQNKRNPVFQNWDSLHAVLVLFDTSEYDESDMFIEYLKKSGKQVSACGYIAKGDNYDYSETPYRMLSPKIDYDSAGFPSDEVIASLSTVTYDAIIDLTLKKNHTMEYILLSIVSPFKIGLNKDDIPMYDFSISVTEDTLEKGKSLSVGYLGKQILYYLRTIRTE